MEKDPVSDVAWKVTQAYVNQVLREGSTRHAQEILEARERSRKYRDWLKHMRKKDSFNQNTWNE